jgi:predicted short-subunit dehydrogenase-like oxidoreductase (DUF2520 family)
MKLALIGSGNIATFFGQRWADAGIPLVQLIARNPFSGNALAERLHLPLANSVDELDQEADTVLLAVSDDALPLLVQHPALSKKRLIYASGAVTMSEMQPGPSITGIACLWPVLSISAHQLPVTRELPLVCSVSDEQTKTAVLPLAKALSDTQHWLSEEQKQIAHLSAVLCNNFTNHLFALAQDLTAKHQVPFELLLPLIQHTVNGLNDGSAAAKQTGPAIRHDLHTIEKHLRILQENEDLRSVYKVLTNSIQHKHPKPASSADE